uniref:RNA-directed DNA polymerase, eukaryota n=1 Tax=Tanacetum cinerariifolium TaxID=118510 RepID=A0A6L2KVL8_TANCI|nr:hypothetical protein [Tanacetum cinerariifolium]
MAYVQEIGTWSISILDAFTAAHPSEDEREVPEDENSVDANSEDGIDDIINDLHDNIGHKGDNQDYTNSPNKEKDDDQIKKDIKGFSLINEMTRINEVGDSLCYDVIGCRTSLKKMIDRIGIKESKMTRLEIFLLKSMWGDYAFDYACSMARGRPGGLISMWDPNIFVKKDICYGPQDPSDREAWLYFSQTHADMFNTFITNNDLIELPTGSRSFTWMNKSDSKLRKLDCFLFSNIVIQALSDAHVIALYKLWSDHNPILFQRNKVYYGPTLFRIFHSWFNRDGFDDFISNEWNSFDQSNSNQILMSHEKFKNLKAKIKPWVRDIKSSEHRHKEDMLLALKNLEVKIDSNSATDEDRESRIEFLHEIDKIDRCDSLDLFQKSRINWDIEGDENSKFFHGIVNQRRRTNSIHGIIWVIDSLIVKDTFLKIFKEKFELHDSSSALPSTSFPSTLTVDGHSLLEKDVTLDEIKSAVWNCGND